MANRLFSECENSSCSDSKEELDLDLQLELESKIDTFLSEAPPEKRNEFREWVKNEVNGTSSDSSESQPQKVLKRQFLR